MVARRGLCRVTGANAYNARQYGDRTVATPDNHAQQEPAALHQHRRWNRRPRPHQCPSHQPSSVHRVPRRLRPRSPDPWKINLTTNDYISNSALTGSGLVSGSNYMSLRRDDGVTATTSASVV